MDIMMIVIQRGKHQRIDYRILRKFHPETLNQAERGGTKPSHLKNLLKKPARSSRIQLDEKDPVIVSD